MSKTLKEVHFFKKLAWRRQHPARPLLERHKKIAKIDNFPRKYNFSKICPAGGSTPARPLLENRKKSIGN